MNQGIYFLKKVTSLKLTTAISQKYSRISADKKAVKNTFQDIFPESVF